MGVTAVFTHQLALFIFGIFLTHWLITNRFLSRLTNQSMPSVYPLIIPILVAVSYWVLVDEIFAIGLVIASGTFSSQIINSPTAVSAGEGEGGIITLGTTLTTNNIIDSVSWLWSIEGIYFSILVALLTLCIVSIVENNASFNQGTSVVSVGLMGSILFLKTPLSIESKSRIALMWVPFVAIAIGRGIAFLKPANDHQITARSTSAVLVVALLVSGPLLVPFDTFDSGYSPKESYSKSTVNQLQELTKYSETSNSQISATHADAVMLRRFGAVQNEQINIVNQTVTSVHPILIRRNMSENRLSIATGEKWGLQPLIVSEEWVSKQSEQQSSIYHSGELRLIISRG
ncbi:hypothetical protein ACFQH3_19090 [Haladaptatus sp. GCM10025707]